MTTRAMRVVAMALALLAPTAWSGADAAEALVAGDIDLGASQIPEAKGLGG